MSIKITKLEGLNAVSIKQNEGDRTFISSSNSFIISIPSLSYIILALIKLGFMDKEVLKGILEEVNTK